MFEKLKECINRTKTILTQWPRFRMKINTMKEMQQYISTEAASVMRGDVLDINNTFIGWYLINSFTFLLMTLRTHLKGEAYVAIGVLWLTSLTILGLFFVKVGKSYFKTAIQLELIVIRTWFTLLHPVTKNGDNRDLYERVQYLLI